MMTNVTQWLHNTLGISPDIQANLLSSLITIVILWFIRFVIVRIAWRRTTDLRIRYQWTKITMYVAVAIGLVLVGRIWFEGVHSLATFLGLLSAGLAIALKELIANLAAWVFIIWRRPFETGDRIQIGQHRGDVLDVRIFQFTIMEIGNWVDADQSTGRIIHLPNGFVFTQAQINYSKGLKYIWDEIPVLITFESAWQKAKEILLSIVSERAEHLSSEAQKALIEASKKFMIYYTTFTPTVYTAVKECGVLLTLRYLVEPRKRRSQQELIWEDILREFEKNSDIDFAYPTQRFFNNAIEGKSDLRPQSMDDSVF